MKKNLHFTSLFLFVLLAMLSLAACSAQNAPLMSQSDVEATVNAAVQQTQTVVALSATPTSLPSATVAPTDVPTLEVTEAPAAEGATAAPASTGEGSNTTVPSGDWILFQDSEGNFEISLPSTWSYIDLAKGEFSDKLTELLANNPKMAEMYSDEAIQNMVKSGIKFYALEATADSLSSAIPTSLNVISTDLGMTIPLEEYARLSLDQLTQVYGDIEISSQVINLGDVQAIEIKYQAPVPGADGVTRDAALVQYLFLENTNQYVLTFAGTAETVAAGYDTFLKIAKSFKLK